MQQVFIFIIFNFLAVVFKPYYFASSASGSSEEERSIVFHSFSVDKKTLADIDMHEYFTDCFVEAEDHPEPERSQVLLKLKFPTTFDFFVDPKLSEGLTFFCGVTPPLHHIPYQVKRNGNILETLNDNWTLWGWSQWYRRNYAALTEASTLVILHFDDHTDFMSPRVHISGDEIFDSITNRQINLLEPDSIVSAIHSTSIGIGSFIAPFLWQLNSKIKNIKILHVSKRYLRSPEFFKIIIDAKQEHFPKDLQRLELKLSALEGLTNRGVEYVRSADLSTLLSCISDEDRILAHFDLDCFNNRYDRSSDWHERESIHDPVASKIMEEINTVCESLHSAVGLERLEEIAIAYCPGFFPAEFWKDAYEILMAHFKKGK